jgi:hypothetical protein
MTESLSRRTVGDLEIEGDSTRKLRARFPNEEMSWGRAFRTCFSVLPVTGMFMHCLNIGIYRRCEMPRGLASINNETIPQSEKVNRAIQLDTKRKTYHKWAIVSNIIMAIACGIVVFVVDIKKIHEKTEQTILWEGCALLLVIYGTLVAGLTAVKQLDCFKAGSPSRVGSFAYVKMEESKV